MDIKLLGKYELEQVLFRVTAVSEMGTGSKRRLILELNGNDTNLQNRCANYSIEGDNQVRGF